MKRFLSIVAAGLLAALILFGSYVWIRSRRAAAEVERTWLNTEIAPMSEIGTTRSLEILPIYEEAGDPGTFQIGHGLSYLIKTDTKTVLLDVGMGPKDATQLPMEQNMEALDISPEQIDALVFSHFHPDHTGGVDAWRQQKAYLGSASQDLAGISAYIPSQFEVPGMETELSLDPTLLASGVATTGSIRYKEPFPISVFNSIGAEQSLAVNVEGEGIVLIMGCGHPSVERLVARAEALFADPVIAIIGGVHSDGASMSDIQSQINFMVDNGIRLVAISPHDSGQGALLAYEETFGGGYLPIQVGQPLVIP